MTGRPPLRLYIDDERPVPPGFDTVARTSANAIQILEEARASGRPVALISFDHDLADLIVDGAAVEADTRPVLQWIISEGFWPAEIRVHSASRDGHEWLVDAASAAAPDRCVVDPTDPWASPGFENAG